MSEGAPGKPGLPGEPGVSGGGTGGHGGEGGKGGRGGGKVSQRRALVGYVVLVVVAVGIVALYQVHTTRTLNKRDAQSCAQRNRLAQNQRAVLGGLIAVLTIEADEADAKRPGTHASLLAILKDLRERQPHAGPEVC